jgi:hypothetical protein
MPADLLLPPEGVVRAYAVDERLQSRMKADGYWPAVWYPGSKPPGWARRTGWKRNDVLYEWGAIVGQLLMRRGLQYGISGMYLEFENTASPGDPVSPPALSRAAGEGVDYFAGLSTSDDRDYLRVPLIASTLETTDETLFPKGNAPTFFAQSSGVEGVHGKTFSDSANSVVFGGALVAFVDAGDPTQDLVLSRFYLEVSDQQAKLSTSQIGLEWQLRLQ